MLDWDIEDSLCLNVLLKTITHHFVLFFSTLNLIKSIDHVVVTWKDVEELQVF